MAGIRRVQERLGPDRISALMTTTEASLDRRAAEIIDSYAELRAAGDLSAPDLAIWFRAARAAAAANYGVDRWLEFYAAGLERVVELNRRGIPMVEIYASHHRQEDAHQR